MLPLDIEVTNIATHGLTRCYLLVKNFKHILSHLIEKDLSRSTVNYQGQDDCVCIVTCYCNHLESQTLKSQLRSLTYICILYMEILHYPQEQKQEVPCKTFPREQDRITRSELTYLKYIDGVTSKFKITRRSTIIHKDIMLGDESIESLLPPTAQNPQDSYSVKGDEYDVDLEVPSTN